MLKFIIREVKVSLLVTRHDLVNGPPLIMPLFLDPRLHV